jgi:hypothetical protein
MGRPLAFLSDLLTSAIVMHLNKQTPGGKPSFPAQLESDLIFLKESSIQVCRGEREI